MTYALLFPGQGSQFPGMGKGLAERFPAARETFQEADEVLGFALSRLCFEGPEDQLRLTVHTQPAILVVSVAAFRALSTSTALSPAFVAGHSLGEYSALVAAGSLSLPDALQAVRQRGQAMQDAVPRGVGAMAAFLGMDRAGVEDVCREASRPGAEVWPANFNSPEQTVVAGHAQAVRAAMELFKAKGGKRALELPVSAPFHCPLMEPAARKVSEFLGNISIDSPKTVLINNAEAKPLTEAAQVRPSLVRQVTSPVRWEESTRAMAAEGVRAFLELGPGKVLAGLVKRIERNALARSFGEPDEFEPAAAFLEAAGTKEKPA